MPPDTYDRLMCWLLFPLFHLGKGVRGIGRGGIVSSNPIRCSLHPPAPAQFVDYRSQEVFDRRELDASI
jgi:hypothetical protein